MIETETASQTRTEARRWWFRPLLLGITLVLCLGLAEAGVRIFWSPDYPKQPARWQFDPELGLAHTPGHYQIPFRRCVEAKDCEDVFVRFSINNQGFRAVSDYHNPAGRPLIAVLGDSMIEAAQVDDDKTMRGVLEETLRSSFPGVEVRNAGMNSAGFVHYYARWRKLIAPMHPEVLIVAALGMNDFRNCSTSLETFVAMRPHYSEFENGRREAHFEPIPNPHSTARRAVASLYEPLELTRFLRWLSAVRQESANVEASSGAFPADARIYEEPPLADYAEAAALGREYLERLIREATITGTRVIVVYLPWAGEAVDEQWSQMNSEYEHGPHNGKLVRTRPEQMVRDTTEEAGGEFFSFSDIARGLKPEEQRALWHVRIDSHLTEHGNRLLAESLAPVVRETIGR